MKSNVKISSAMFLAMCMMFVMSISIGCQKDEKDDVDARDGYIGRYEVEETLTSDGGNKSYDNYTIRIEESDEKKQDILIYNFFGLGNSSVAIATVKGNSFTIPRQEISDGSETGEIKGSGTKKGSTLTYTFDVTLEDGSHASVKCVAEKM